MDGEEMTVPYNASGVNLEAVATDMEVENCVEQRTNGAVEEAHSNGTAVVANGDGSIPMEQKAIRERNDNDLKPALNIEKRGLAILAGEEEEGVGGHLRVETVVARANESAADGVGLSVAELVAKGRAPVKNDFLTVAPVRIMISNGTVTRPGATNGAWDDRSEPRVVPEKKSKRQMKRERLQAKKSTEGICAIVARTGDVKQCPYAANCRFNHDLEGYRAQKPPDLPGSCPSLDTGEQCSYGLACRFAGTHKEVDGQQTFRERRSNMASNELNSLSKELQKLLWKNMGSFPKADSHLQAMGLMTKAFKMRKAEAEETQIAGSGQGDNTKESNGDVVRSEGDEPVEEFALETVATVPVDAEEQGVTQTKGCDSDNNGNLPKNSTTAKQLVRSDDLAPSCTVDASSPPQKRLKSEADEPMRETCAQDSPSTDCERVTVHTSDKLVESKPDVSDAPIEDDQAKIEIGKSAPKKESWRDLYVEAKLGAREKKLIDFREKLYLAPLTTVGNLPFRRVCKGLGADITCGEMAMCTNLLQGQASEWALLRRHSCEDLFGVQICGSFPDHVARTAELIEQECTVDFIDINMGCPIDLVVNKGSGSCLLTKPQRLEQLCRVTAAVMENPLTVKMRMGYYEGRNCAHALIPNLSEWGVSAVTVHGRTRQQRYSKQADWAYVKQCVAAAEGDLQVIGNGDVFSYTDWTEHLNSSGSKLSTCMVARGALIKPWLFTEIKERRHWDISSGERLDILRQYVHCGLAHWGSDSKGVETTRHFLLEWLSYMHRYIPVGLLEVVPQRLNWRPPSYFGRNDLETMMASESAADWVRISELLLGPTPANFVFNPKHKSNAYDKAENG